MGLFSTIPLIEQIATNTSTYMCYSKIAERMRGRQEVGRVISGGIAGLGTAGNTMGSDGQPETVGMAAITTLELSFRTWWLCCFRHLTP